MLIKAGAALVLSGAEPGLPAIPPPNELLALVKHGHPRLLASEKDFDALKQRISTNVQLQTWRIRLRDDAQKIIRQPPSQYEIPDGLRLLATSRRVVDRIYTLALLYRLERDPAYLQRAWRELEAAARFPDWNPRHFLDTAEMSHAFAIGYDWLYDAWTQEQRDVLHHALVTKGLQPALSVFRGQTKTFWPKARHNWNQVCNGGIGLGALALAEVEPQRAGELLHDTLESLPLAMAEFSPDGAWKEGPGYWDYATSYNVAYLAGLQSALGTDFGLSQMSGFSLTGLFPLYMTSPIGRTFNYADSSDHSLQSPQLFWLGRQFDQPLLARYQIKAARPHTWDFLWFDPSRHSANTNPPLDKYFRGAEVATFRSAWDDTNAPFVGLKAGDNKANHSHLDLGSFVFDALGSRWALDLGSDNYNFPGYFGKDRWSYYRLRAEGHNVPVINPGTEPDQDPRAVARILKFESRPQRAFALTDLSPAYASRAHQVRRGLAFLNRRSLLVQDEIQTDKPSEIWWFMHTPASIQIQSEGRVAILQQHGGKVRAEILSPPLVTFQAMDAQPLTTSPHPERQAANEGIKKLAIHLTGITDTRLAVLLVPFGPGSESLPSSPKVTALAEW